MAAFSIPLLGWVDYLTGYELSISPFYFVPIAVAAWYGGKLPGIAAALSCALVWAIADQASGHTYSHIHFFVWNSSIRLGSFLVILVLVLDRRDRMHRERERAHADPLTGLANRRRLHEQLDMEIERSRRHGHPLSLAYIDLDGFKEVNDRIGHHAGDHVLQIVATALRAHLRREDTAARIGGDEFAVLLPETTPQAAAFATERAHGAVVEALRDAGYDVTASIGCVTCMAAPRDSAEIIRYADTNMYGVKRAGGNAVLATVIGAQGDSPDEEDKNKQEVSNKFG